MKYGFIDIKGSCVTVVNNFARIPTFNLKLDQKYNKKQESMPVDTNGRKTDLLQKIALF